MIILVAGALISNIKFAAYLKKKNNSNAKETEGFAIVELFTSEGCSSCPPADAVVAKVSTEYKEKIFVLGFHVDYWDRLGWKDIFSSAAYSKRQREYARVFHLNSVYTPQIIVNGKSEFVGSNESRLRSTISQELKNKPDATVELNAKSSDGRALNISYKVDHVSNAILNIALVQLHAQTTVKRGENDGRLLHHINIVRDFKAVDLNKGSQGNVDLILPAGLSKTDFKVIAYLQDTGNLQVKAATEIAVE